MGRSRSKGGDGRGGARRVPADPWVSLGLSRLLASAHVRPCILCKQLLDQCVVSDDRGYMARVRDGVVAHSTAHDAGSAHRCHYSRCVHHEGVPRDLALRMIALGRGDRPWRDIRGVTVSTIPLVVTEGDRPEGFDMKGLDAALRGNDHLPLAAGYVYVRLGPKRVRAHVWIEPAVVPVVPTEERHEFRSPLADAPLDVRARIEEVSRHYRRSRRIVRERGSP